MTKLTPILQFKHKIVNIVDLFDCYFPNHVLFL